MADKESIYVPTLNLPRLVRPQNERTTLFLHSHFFVYYRDLYARLAHLRVNLSVFLEINFIQQT